MQKKEIKRQLLLSKIILALRTILRKEISSSHHLSLMKRLLQQPRFHY